MHIDKNLSTDWIESQYYNKKNMFFYTSAYAHEPITIYLNTNTPSIKAILIYTIGSGKKFRGSVNTSWKQRARLTPLTKSHQMLKACAQTGQQMTGCFHFSEIHTNHENISMFIIINNSLAYFMYSVLRNSNEPRFCITCELNFRPWLIQARTTNKKLRYPLPSICSSKSYSCAKLLISVT